MLVIERSARPRPVQALQMRARPMPPALLTRIADGDSNAVGEFLRQHTSLVWGLARRVCRTAQDAEDAVQEIFVEVWRLAERYDPEQGSEATFLTTIARRRLIDRMRRRGRRPAPDQLEDASILPAEPVRDPVELDDDVERVREALQQLRPEQREVLELSLGQGQTHQEISASVGIPLGTVKSHARRGLIRLRALLGVAEGERGTP